MRYYILLLLFFIPLPASAQDTNAPQALAQGQRILIQKIEIEGFVLPDRNQFVKLFKPHRNKHLSAIDIDTILQQVGGLYEQAGYQGLVSIKYHIIKRNLIFTVSLI